MSEPTPATEGTTFSMNGDEFVVGPKCDVPSGGRWVCTTHGETFQHNWAKDTHVERGSGHVLAWVCFAHGPEVP